MYNTPILFLIFARPDTTSKVFEKIKKIKPSKLYIAADAPRKYKSDEIKRSMQAREIVGEIDWDCKVKRLYRDENLGCMTAVSEAINWFFEEEEYGVILEDDCLPDLSFFPFCEELLVKYKHDNRIGHIGGSSFFPKLLKGQNSYVFSSIPEIWGWASWRRVWKNYDAKFSYYEKSGNKQNLPFLNFREKVYFSSFIPDVLSMKINTWDMQYYFMLRLQHQLSITPSINLVSNIGLNTQFATHTKGGKNALFIPFSEMKFPLNHPLYLLTEKRLDEKVIKCHFFSYKRCFRYLIELLK
jgi:hypothetical protein